MLTKWRLVPRTALSVPRNRHHVRIFFSKHSELIGLEGHGALDGFCKFLDVFPQSGEDGGKDDTDDKDGHCDIDKPDDGPCDCCEAKYACDQTQRDEEGCHAGEKGRVVALRSIGDVEFELDQIVEACEEQSDVPFLTIAIGRGVPSTYVP